MTGPEHQRNYNNELFAIHYRPGRTPQYITPEITDTEAAAFELAYEISREALAEGNPPCGAVLVVNDGEHVYGGKTHDKTSRDIRGHAELVAYGEAQHLVGDDLSRSTLTTTAVPCNTCATPYAEGRIRKIIASAPRRYVFPLTGLMRPRKINAHELLHDGATETILIMNYKLERTLAQFALYGKMTGHQLPNKLDPFLEAFVQQNHAA